MFDCLVHTAKIITVISVNILFRVWACKLQRNNKYRWRWMGVGVYGRHLQPTDYSHRVHCRPLTVKCTSAAAGSGL